MLVVFHSACSASSVTRLPSRAHKSVGVLKQSVVFMAEQQRLVRRKVALKGDLEIDVVQLDISITAGIHRNDEPSILLQHHRDGKVIAEPGVVKRRGRRRTPKTPGATRRRYHLGKLDNLQTRLVYLKR